MENVKHKHREGVQLFINKDLELEVRAIKNKDGSISLNAEDTAIGFGWYQIKNGKTYVRWETINAYCKELKFSQHVGKDVAEVLGYSNSRDALRNHVDEEDKASVAIYDGRQNQERPY